MSTPERHRHQPHPTARAAAHHARPRTAEGGVLAAKRRSPGRALLIAGAIALVVVLGSLAWYSQALRPAGGDRTSVTVDEGQTVDSIADELKAKRVIRSPLAFKIHVRLHGQAAKFKAGTFAVSGKESAPKVADTLAEGTEVSDKFTIKEGRSQRQIAKQLGEAGIVDEQEFAGLKAADFPQYDFLKGVPAGGSLEGFLFPETYSVPPPGTSAKDVATIMLNQFRKELTPELQGKIRASGRSLFETVTIASILEEEVQTDKDKRIVAGIVENRLKEGIPLGLDTTLMYGLRKTEKQLTHADLAGDSPYNTRTQKGLPPGPISNPGLAALEATADPQATDYLFFLSASDGTTYYAKTNDEHEKNKDKYLR